MNAPDRSAEVAAVFAQHPGVLDGPPETADDRKRAFLPVIVKALNVLDGGHWGLLLKTDQGNKIPADVIVWRLTMEHFDVLTDSWPMWGAHGPVSNPKWIWLRAAGEPEPAPIPTPAPTPGPDFAAILDAVRGMSSQVDALRASVLATRADVLMVQAVVKDLHGRPVPGPVVFPPYRGRLFGMGVTLTPEG